MLEHIVREREKEKDRFNEELCKGGDFGQKQPEQGPIQAVFSRNFKESLFAFQEHFEGLQKERVNLK